MKKLLSSKILLFAVPLVLVFGFVFTNDIGTKPVSARYPNISVAPACNDDYENWTDYSTTYKANTPWSLDFMNYGANAATNGVREQFVDLNGDGLMDYFYASKYQIGDDSYSVNTIDTCVVLNNGEGWNVVHKCHGEVHFDDRTGVISSSDFYGDCADTSS